MELNYAGFIPISTVDWHGRSVATIFLRGCNFNCVYCHNREFIDGESLIKHKEIEKKIMESKPFISAVVISGGEPVLQKYVVAKIARFARSQGLFVGIHTNGSMTDDLNQLLDAGLIDKVFIDIKAPFTEKQKYSEVIGINDECAVNEIIYDIRETIQMAERRVPIELRTTIISDLINDSYQICQIAMWIYDYIDSEASYVLQQGNPEHYKFKAPIVTREEMIKLAMVAKKYLKNVRIRTTEGGEEAV